MRKMRPGKNRITNSGGFSLVELLVAVLILAVIFIPLMHSFVTAARTNMRAKKVMEAATAGQNVFEELKANTVADFMPAATKTDTGKKDAQNNTIYTLSTEFDRTVNGRKLHIKVTLDPQDYTTKDGDAQKQTDYNSIGWSSLSSLSKSSNAFLIMSSDDTQNAVNELAMMMPGVDPDDIRAGLKRHVEIAVSHGSSTGVSIVKASVTYSYGAYSYLALDKQEIYNNGTELANELSNVFICYFPMYNNSGRTSPTETFTVDNTGNYPIGVYLVRQDIAATPLEQSRYSAKMEVKEGTRNMDDPPVTSLSTNLEYRDGMTASNELQLVYTGNSLPAGKKLSEVVELSEKNSGGLARAKSATRIYKVTIEIYEEKVGGGYDLLTTMEGTKTE